MHIKIIVFILTILLSLNAHSLSIPKNNEVEYDIIRKNKIIGSHKISFTNNDEGLIVETNINIQVKVLLITAYKFSHSSREIWVDGNFVKINAPYVGSYIHAGNKIATVVGLSKTNDDLLDDMINVSKDISMQVAAMNPIALNEEGVDSNVIEKEIEIAKDQLRAEGKPEAMLDNIAKGKLKRFFKDNTLINQAFIKDTKISVSDYLSSFDKELTVACFDRVSIG